MWKNLTATGFAGALLAMAVTPSGADELFIPYQPVSLPNTGTLAAFDISFVNKKLRTLAVAASRVVDTRGPFGTVVIVNTDDNIVTKELIPNPPFAGACSFPGRNTVSGPNGVIVIKEGLNAEVWAGDGPVLTAAGQAHICSVTTGTAPIPVAGDIASPSTVKVLDLNSGATKAVISTGGNGRADELCYSHPPASPSASPAPPPPSASPAPPPSIPRVVLMANDEPFDNFITFIDADTYQVIQQIKFDGTDPNGNNIHANGIEQCIFNEKDGNFYINIPNTVQGSNTTAPGVTLRISGTAPYQVEAIVADFSKAPWNTTGCTGGTGIALGPDDQLANNCGLIISFNTGAIIANFPAAGGADELWFNHGHYFLADSTPAHLGVIDSGLKTNPSVDLSTTTAVGSHSVAADSETNLVYVPIRGNNAVAGSGAVCSKATDSFGIAGSDALGCILSYVAPRDGDDH
jgi:hypothetical protein